MKIFLSIIFSRRVFGIVLLFSTPFLRSQITISDLGSAAISSLAYSSFNGSWSSPVNQIVQNANYFTIQSVSGGTPYGEGSVDFSIGSNVTDFIDLSAYNSLTLKAQSVSGNLNDTFTIKLVNFDGININDVALAQFSAAAFNSTSFSTQTSLLTYINQSLMNHINYWELAGSGSVFPLSSEVAFSFDNFGAVFSAVPEPMTSWMSGIGFFLLVLIRRKQLRFLPVFQRGTS